MTYAINLYNSVLASSSVIVIKHFEVRKRLFHPQCKMEAIVKGKSRQYKFEPTGYIWSMGKRKAMNVWCCSFPLFYFYSPVSKLRNDTTKSRWVFTPWYIIKIVLLKHIQGLCLKFFWIFTRQQLMLVLNDF